MTTTVTAKIQIRKGTAAAWTSANPTLLSGEIGYETDTGKLKMGDGTTDWTSLAYYHDPDLVGTYEPADATILKQADVDDTPVNGVITAPVSSNWAFDHAALVTAHGISTFGASLVDDTDAGTARSTLGLGTAATTASTDYATAAHNHSGTYEPADATIIKQADVDDTPVNGVTTAPVSSNWAYDHAALATAHGISTFGASLVDDDDAGTARSTLGLGTAATTASTDYATATHNHTGVYEPAGTAASAIASHEGAADPHTGYALESSLGGAALLSVGTTTGTVAAGDDARFSTGTTGDAFASSHPGGNQHIDWTADQGATDLHAGNIPDLSGTYATAAKGVTNGDSHDHSGGDGAQISYTNLSNLPTLGTAAATDATAYATATQGSKADTALQPGDVDDTPVNGATTAPVSSNWAYDHAAIAVVSNTTGVTGADQITNMMSLTQAEYDAIGSPSATTLYVITD